MKKILFLILIIFSCEKQEPQKDQCWICEEKENATIVRTWETCNVLEASQEDGKRWVTSVVVSPAPNYVTRVTVHTINCEEK